jgi:SAM-dependent methyltransferase
MSATAVRDPRGLRTDRAPARLRSTCGRVIPLHIDRWFDEATLEELQLLSHAIGPVLDVGCGPARHVLALRAAGVAAVGVDNAPSVVRLARSRGAVVVEASLFDRLPNEGKWASALLLDGNLGIGGDVERLLGRMHAVLRPGGRALVEVAAPGRGHRRLRVQAEIGGSPVTGWFPWAEVSADEIAAVAGHASFTATSIWTDADRWFGILEAR